MNKVLEDNSREQVTSHKESKLKLSTIMLLTLIEFMYHKCYQKHKRKKFQVKASKLSIHLFFYMKKCPFCRL